MDVLTLQLWLLATFCGGPELGFDVVGASCRLPLRNKGRADCSKTYRTEKNTSQVSSRCGDTHITACTRQVKQDGSGISTCLWPDLKDGFAFVEC